MISVSVWDLDLLRTVSTFIVTSDQQECRKYMVMLYSENKNEKSLAVSNVQSDPKPLIYSIVQYNFNEENSMVSL